MSSKALIESIARSAEKLIAENRRLRGEVGKLDAARERLRDENRRLAAENATLERRLAVKELAAGFAGAAGGAGAAGAAGADRSKWSEGGDRSEGNEGNEGGEGDRGGVGYPAPLDRHGVKIARARVNRLMREVDRCIALINAKQ